MHLNKMGEGRIISEKEWTTIWREQWSSQRRREKPDKVLCHNPLRNPTVAVTTLSAGEMAESKMQIFSRIAP